MVETSTAIVDTLKLAHNQLPAVVGLLAAITPYVSLHRVRTLRWLDLSHNRIAAVPAEALVDLPALTIFYLHANAIPNVNAVHGSCIGVRICNAEVQSESLLR
jgi:hypothetical protein